MDNELNDSVLGAVVIDNLPSIANLLSEAAQFEASLFPPQSKVRQGERVLGEVPEKLRPYAALASYYRREAQRLKLEGKYQKWTEDDKARYSELDSRDDVLMEIFWHALKAHLNFWSTTHGMGIREGWVAVAMAPEKLSDMVRQALSGE